MNDVMSETCFKKTHKGSKCVLVGEEWGYKYQYKEGGKILIIMRNHVRDIWVRLLHSSVYFLHIWKLPNEVKFENHQIWKCEIICFSCVKSVVFLIINAMCPLPLWRSQCYFGRQGGAGRREVCCSWHTIPEDVEYDRLRGSRQRNKSIPPSPEWSSWHPTSLPQPTFLSSPDCPFTRPEAGVLKKPLPPFLIRYLEVTGWKDPLILQLHCRCAHLPASPAPQARLTCLPFLSLACASPIRFCYNFQMEIKRYQVKFEFQGKKWFPFRYIPCHTWIILILKIFIISSEIQFAFFKLWHTTPRILVPLYAPWSRIMSPNHWAPREVSFKCYSYIWWPLLVSSNILSFIPLPSVCWHMLGTQDDTKSWFLPMRPSPAVQESSNCQQVL